MPGQKTFSDRLKSGLKIALPLLALFVGMSSYMTLKSNRPTPPKPVKHESVHPVRTQKIQLASHQPGLKLYGEIKTGRKVELRALVAGKLLKTGDHFKEGSRVKKGDLLLFVDPFQYEGAVVEAKAKISEARSKSKEISAQIKAEEDSIKYALEQLKLSKRDFDRAQKLVRRGSVTRQGADQRLLVVSQRREAVDAKRSSLTILRAKAEQQTASIKTLDWHLRRAERNRRDTSLKAPFSGYLSELNANIGKLLNVNDRVAVLLDSDWMDVVFTLSDRQYGRLLEGKNGLIGRRVTVTWNLGSTPLQYEAVIERVGAQISSETGGITVYAKLENPSLPRPIRTGAFVDVDVPDAIYHKVVRLPQTSLYERTRVYVVGPDDRLRKRLVTLHSIDGEYVLVSGALADGERVIITRMSTIGEGMKVRDLRKASKDRSKPKKGKPDDVAPKDDGQGDDGQGKAEQARKENSWKPTLGGAVKGGSDVKHKGKRRRGEQGLKRGARQNRG